MPNPRLRYKRDKRNVGLTDAELWFLDGNFRAEQNIFESICLAAPSGPRRSHAVALIRDYGHHIPDWRRPILDKLLEETRPRIIRTHPSDRPKRRTLIDIDATRIFDDYPDAAVINGIDYSRQPNSNWLAALLRQQASRAKKSRRR